MITTSLHLFELLDIVKFIKLVENSPYDHFPFLIENDPYVFMSAQLSNFPFPRNFLRYKLNTS